MSNTVCIIFHFHRIRKFFWRVRERVSKLHTFTTVLSENFFNKTENFRSRDHSRGFANPGCLLWHCGPSWISVNTDAHPLKILKINRQKIQIKTKWRIKEIFEVVFWKVRFPEKMEIIWFRVILNVVRYQESLAWQGGWKKYHKNLVSKFQSIVLYLSSKYVFLNLVHIQK